MKVQSRSSTLQDIPALTGLRGFAALWVAMYHAWVLAVPREISITLLGVRLELTPLFSLGWAGVQVFFVLSGFLLAQSFVRWRMGLGSKPAFKPYFIRRAARVFPGFHVQLIILMGASWWFAGTVTHAPGDVLRYLLMLFFPQPLGTGPVELNGVWWTLPIEFSFYLLLPFAVSSLIWSNRFLILGSAFFIVCAWRLYVVLHLGTHLSASELVLWACQLPGSLDSFACGVFGAMVYTRMQSFPHMAEQVRKYMGHALLSAAILIWVLFRWMDSSYMGYWSFSVIFLVWTPLFSVAVLTFVLACASDVRVTTILFGNKVMVWCGTVSYGVYLWHHPVQKWLQTSFALPQYDSYVFPALFLISLAITIPLAALSWYLVESPLIARAGKIR